MASHQTTILSSDVGPPCDPALHASAPRSAVTKFGMPAMSPTMTEGGIASWKKKEGDKFETGDILLEIVRLSRTPACSTHIDASYGSIGNG